MDKLCAINNIIFNLFIAWDSTDLILANLFATSPKSSEMSLNMVECSCNMDTVSMLHHMLNIDKTDTYLKKNSTVRLLLNQVESCVICLYTKHVTSTVYKENVKQKCSCYGADVTWTPCPILQSPIKVTFNIFKTQIFSYFVSTMSLCSISIDISRFIFQIVFNCNIYPAKPQR